MNKSELVAAVAKHTGESQAAVGRVIDAMFETIGASIKKGDKVIISKYGGTEVKLDGVVHLLLREDDILGILG